MSDLFTICVEYDGGTYISQFKAEDPSLAIRLWCESFEYDEKINKKTRNIAVSVRQSIELSNECPVQLEGIENVWCICSSYRKNLILLNIIKTAQ
ncbi:MAG: hypothetical protein ACK41P_03880 [Asticcacaulis sp.]